MADEHVRDRMSPGQFGGPENVDRLRPNWLGRLLILIPCGLVVGGAVTAWLASPTRSGLDVAIIIFLMCAYVIVRWMFFMGVRRDGAFLVVTGALWSRRILLSRIERVTDFTVFVWWRTRSGLRMFTPVVAFTAQEGAIEFMARRNRWALAHIRQWVEEDRMASALGEGASADSGSTPDTN